MVAEEVNQERMDQLLTINDLINGVLHNYDCFKSGSGTRREINGVVGPTSGPTSAESTGAICLIDLDDDDDTSRNPSSSLPKPSSSSSAPGGGMADLLGDLDFTSSGSAKAPPGPSKKKDVSDIDQLFMMESKLPASSSSPSKNGIYNTLVKSL